jgi:hypothetical protein
MTLIVDPGQWDVALITLLGQLVVPANLEDGPERLFWNGNLLPCAKSYRTRPQMTALGEAAPRRSAMGFTAALGRRRKVELRRACAE